MNVLQLWDVLLSNVSYLGVEYTLRSGVRMSGEVNFFLNQRWLLSRGNGIRVLGNYDSIVFL